MGGAATTRVTVSTMGGLGIALNGDRVEHLIPDKAALLVVYLTDSGGTAQRSRLAGLLWSDLPEDRARANLRVALTRLRPALGDLVSADRERVWLTVTPEYDGDKIASGGADAIAEHYLGEFLAGVEVADAELFNDWVDARRESLRTSAMLRLSEDLAEARRGERWDAGTTLATRIVELEPRNERAHCFLMEAAALRSGRTAALEQYQRCVDALEQGLGLPPDDETTALAAAIRSGANDQGPSPLRPTVVTQIPFDLTPLLGRDDEVTHLVQRVVDSDYRLHTIVGPGGVGKTRVAAEVARQLDADHPGSVVWASLAAVSTPHELAATLIELLVPDAVFSHANPLAQLVAAIGGRPLTLVLDNFEQLVDPAGELLLDVLRACTAVKAIITSRRTMDVAAEDVFALGGLPTPAGDETVARSAAVRLFVDRAYRADKSFRLSADNSDDIAELCRLLEGIPLHLELTAARVATLPVRELIDHINAHASLPGDGPRDTPGRHQTFDAVFAQSWDLLTPDERRALTKLSVTRGGFGHEAAARLLGSDGSEPGRLARMSLLTEERGGRFRFHELVRQSAAARISPDDQTDAEIAHATWYLGQLSAAEDALVSSNAVAAASRLLPDLENIHRAWEIALQRDLTTALASAAEGLSHLFEMAGRAVETEQLMAAAATACAIGTLTTTDAVDEAFFLRIQARQRAAWSMDDDADQLCRRVATLLADRPDRALDLAWSQLHHAQAAYHHGEVSTALQLLEASEATASGLDDPVLRAWSLAQRGRILSTTSSFDDAAAAFHEAISLFSEGDNQRGHAQTLSYLAVTHAEQNQVWDAFVADRASLELCQATGNRQLVSGRHENLAASYLLLGDYEKARDHTAEALAIYRRNAEWDMESYALAQHGECLLGLGDIEAGENDLSTGVAMMRDEQFSFGLLYNLPPWIRHLQRQGRDDQALLACEELVSLASDRGAEHFVLTGQALLARSAAAVGQTEEALAIAHEVWGALQAPDPPRLPWALATLLDLYAVFDVIDDPRRRDVLAEARATRQETARSIADPALRRCYLEQHTASVELTDVVRRHDIGES